MEKRQIKIGKRECGKGGIEEEEKNNTERGILFIKNKIKQDDFPL